MVGAVGRRPKLGAGGGRGDLDTDARSLDGLGASGRRLNVASAAFLRRRLAIVKRDTIKNGVDVRYVDLPTKNKTPGAGTRSLERLEKLFGRLGSGCACTRDALAILVLGKVLGQHAEHAPGKGFFASRPQGGQRCGGCVAGDWSEGVDSGLLLVLQILERSVL